MGGNSNLHDSRSGKTDEFYTDIHLIEDEVKHYREHFRGKTVLCNCDDPRVSNFFRFFVMQFDVLGLKKVIATCYKNNNPDLFSTQETEKAVYLEYAGETKYSSPEDFAKIPCKELKGNGDFRSAESIDFLKEADIVCTNPPFSLFREYIAQLFKYDKKFLIIGNMNNITYNGIFPLIRDNKLWLGYNSGHFWFQVPEHYEEKATDFKIIDGIKYRRMGNICWYTNLDIQKRHEVMETGKKYNPEDYQKYDNYDAIEVGRTVDIPMDYYEEIGVPITFLDKYNPDQFEFLGIDKEFTSDGGRFTIRTTGGGTAFIRSPRDKKETLMNILKKDYGYSDGEIEYRSGIMGVPITFMDKYSPDQFEILGKIDTGEINEYNLGNPTVNGKSMYKRIAIRRK